MTSCSMYTKLVLISTKIEPLILDNFVNFPFSNIGVLLIFYQKDAYIWRRKNIFKNAIINSVMYIQCLRTLYEYIYRVVQEKKDPLGKFKKK